MHSNLNGLDGLGTTEGSYCTPSVVFIGPRYTWSPICNDIRFRVSETPRSFANLTDVTLADEDTN